MGHPWSCIPLTDGEGRGERQTTYSRSRMLKPTPVRGIQEVFFSSLIMESLPLP